MTDSKQLSLFGEAEMGRFTLEELIEAFRKCLRGKTNKHEAQDFHKSYMSGCVRLWRSLNDCTYQPSRFISFIT